MINAMNETGPMTESFETSKRELKSSPNVDSMLVVPFFLFY